MKALITGTSTLYDALKPYMPIDNCRIEEILEGKIDLSDYSVLINYAHVGFKQVEVLEHTFNEWKYDSDKYIFNISSRAAQPNISKGYMYASQKAALNHYANNLHWNCEQKNCRITNLDLGAVALPGIPSLSWQLVADTILSLLISPVEVPNMTLQEHSNYRSVQDTKAALKL